MLRRTYFLALSLLLGPVIGFAGETPDHSPAFTAVPELTAGFDFLYEQKFAEAREVFASWESCNSEDPFGEVAVAASYLFEELHLQGVLTSDFFLNEKRFLHGIDGRPDPERMSHFRKALARARELARERQKTNPGDGEALFALTLAAGMESDAESILQKKHMSALKRAKEANEYAKRLLAQHLDAADAYIAPGIANYIIGSQSAGTRSHSGLAEFTGTRNSVWSSSPRLQRTASTSSRSPKLCLPLPHAVKNRTPLAQKLLRELTEQYPGNELFASEYPKASGIPLQAAPA